VLDLGDPANRRVIDFFAARNQRGRPLEEAAYYPPIGLLTTHPDVLEHLWKKLDARLPEESSRWVNGVPALVQEETGVVLAFGWGTAYALRLPPDPLQIALAAGLSPVMRWSGGSQTDLSADLGPDWVWGWFQGAEPDWVAAAHSAFGPARPGPT
jgi:hypothetical protein